MGGKILSSESDWPAQLEARLEAHEQLIRHLIVTVLARTQEPMETFEGFQRRIAAPLKRRPAAEPDAPGGDRHELRTKERVDAVVKSVRDDLERALAQVTARKR